MSQAFGDEGVVDDDDNKKDEFGPSDEEGMEQDSHGRAPGVFAGHAFLVTGVEVEEKKKLKMEIEAQGGEIVDCHSLVAGKEPSKLLLLTAAPCRTSNFLCGLAVGVCVVSTQWVADCLSSKQLCPFDSYRLDASFDTHTRQRTKVPKHFGRTPMQMQDRVLGGKRIGIIGNRPFHQDHIRMVRFAGGQVVDVTGDSLDYIICEASTKFRPSSSQISGARARKIAIVNSDWLCACVMQQTLVGTEAFRVALVGNGARIRLFCLAPLAAPQIGGVGAVVQDARYLVLTGYFLNSLAPPNSCFSSSLFVAQNACMSFSDCRLVGCFTGGSRLVDMCKMRV